MRSWKNKLTLRIYLWQLFDLNVDLQMLRSFLILIRMSKANRKKLETDNNDRPWRPPAAWNELSK